MPTLISLAKWFDPCPHIKAEKLGGSLINSSPVTQGWQWTGDTDLRLTSLMFGSLGHRVGGVA